jgi:glycosyltransferase involved in cell wall biosynthesis
MHILVCSPSWPTSKTIDFVFVDQLCRAFANAGHTVTVIAPQSLTKCLVRHVPIAKRHYIIKTKEGNKIDIYRPYVISLGNSKIKLKFGTYEQAVKRAFKQMKVKPDVCYGHFWQCIYAIYPITKSKSIPLFGASGEEDVSFYIHKPQPFIQEVDKYLSGIISVSTKNQQECLSLNLVSEDKSIVIPNAIDNKLFRKMNKSECRAVLGISSDDFVVAFVGQFMPRKGTLRLAEALKSIGDNQIKAVFIGSGLEDPSYDGIIYKGRVAHDEVPKWLNAADVFVLPTLNEGCCNAIIEAMACGLPVISSNLPFNWDVLDENNSIMIDPNSVEEIASAIKELKNNPEKCENMSKYAVKTADGLTIRKRAERIIEFIHKQIENDNR